MGRLKRLGGLDVVVILGEAGFVRVRQKGSHVRLERVEGGHVQGLTIPLHAELDTGTLRAIVRQAGQFVDEAWLRARFYTD